MKSKPAMILTTAMPIEDDFTITVLPDLPLSVPKSFGTDFPGSGAGPEIAQARAMMPTISQAPKNVMVSMGELSGGRKEKSMTTVWGTSLSSVLTRNA